MSNASHILGHRAFAPLRHEVEPLVKRLLELEAKTHPNRSPRLGPEASESKDQDSVMAMMLAGHLIERLVGWAIDHQTGQILNGVKGFPWPQDDEAAKKEADDDQNEAAGAAYRDGLARGQGSGQPEINQRILAKLAGRSPILLPELHREVSAGLQALSMGEVRPLFRRALNQSRMGFTLWQSRMRAIEHVYFSIGMKKKKRDATREVADAYVVAFDTVRTWDHKGLAGHFGSGYVLVRKQRARRAGERVYRIQSSIPRTEVDERHVRDRLERYGPPGLASNAQAYKKAARAQKAMNSQKAQ